MNALSARLRAAVKRQNNPGNDLRQTVTQKRVDQEMTISFPIAKRPENGLAQLRIESKENDQKISSLRRQVDQARDNMLQIRRMVVALNSLLREENGLHDAMNEEKRMSLARDRLKEHNVLLNSQLDSIMLINAVPPSVRILNSKIAVINKQIASARTRKTVPSCDSMSFEMQRMRRKCKFYQKECTDLEEFVKCELEADASIDDAEIKELTSKIEQASLKIDTAKSEMAIQKGSQAHSVMVKVDEACVTVQSRDAEIVKQKAKQAELKAALELKQDHINRLEEILDAFKTLKCVN